MLLKNPGSVVLTVFQTVLVLDLALCHSSAILPSAQAIHELIVCQAIFISFMPFGAEHATV